MKTLDQLSDDQVLALGRFIVACTEAGKGARWRARFTDCAARGHFSPFAKAADEPLLKSICDRHGPQIVCVLRSTEVIVAANQVSVAYGAGPLQLPLAVPTEAAGARADSSGEDQARRTA